MQVTAGIGAERLGGIGGADDEDDLHALQRLGDIAGDRLQRDEPLQHAVSLDAAAVADRRQMVVVGALRVKGDPVSLARPLIGDRQPPTARPQHRNVHKTHPILPPVSGIGGGSLLTNRARTYGWDCRWDSAPGPRAAVTPGPPHAQSWQVWLE